MSDEIQIRGLDLPVRIGVPQEERAVWQVLSADIILVLEQGFDRMKDDLRETLDYAEASVKAREIAAERPRQLLETLAAELVGHFLSNPALKEVEITLRKRILPGTDHVAVKMRRARGSS